MRVFVGGVNGTGKTSLLKEYQKKHCCAVIRGAPELMKWMNVSDYAALRALPQRQKLRAVGKMIPTLLKRKRSRLIFFDAHYLNLIHGRVSRVTGDWLALFDKLVVLVAPVETILIRIERDERDRGLFGARVPRAVRLERLADLQRETIVEAEAVAKRFNKPMFMVENIHVETALSGLHVAVQSRESRFTLYAQYQWTANYF